jgi:hypothetical protein
MAYIANRICLEQIKACTAPTVYFAMHTCWWTHDPSHLYTLPGTSIPCDPRGSVLMNAPLADFIAAAEGNPGHYGKHGLAAFMAAHHLNCQVAADDPRPTSLKTWDEYNQALDASGQDRG